MSRAWMCTLLVTLALVARPTTSSAASIVIVNMDGSNEGFNDPGPPVTPAPGNPGTTLGAQRLHVFQAAANVWGALLQSNVEIRVGASFDALTCSGGGAVLGRAGPRSAVAGFAGRRFDDTWYHVAAGNRLNGCDLTPGNDDILAQFNSSIDLGCFGGSRWYYGLDNNQGSNIDLLAVVIHELGHGLGFSTLTDVSSGTFFNGQPDVYARFILDTSTDEHWHEMTSGERAASAIRTGRVVWDGAAVTTEAPQVLQQGAPEVTVNAPAAIAGDLVFGLADFGPAPSSPGVTANVTLAVPNDACGTITNTAQMNGRIALIDRGNCTFAAKAEAAQAAGAVGVVIANNTAGSPPQMTGSSSTLTIPVVSISQADGNRIKAQLGAGVNLTIGFDPSRLAGADASGKVLLYAPDPLELGSSISHFDPVATPNLLMEPIISPDLTSDVDLTLQLLQDIGWSGSPGTACGGGGGTLPPLVQMLEGFPNPFGNRDATEIELPFVLDREAEVELVIMDIRGRVVKQVFKGTLDAGTHNGYSWNGTDEDGRVVDSGIFFARTHAGKEGSTRRIALVR